MMSRRKTKGSEATPAGTHLRSACSSRTLHPGSPDRAWWDGPPAARRGNAAKNPHFRVGFLAEPGYGTSRGKLPTDPAPARHNEPTTHTEKGLQVQSWAQKADEGRQGRPTPRLQSRAAVLRRSAPLGPRTPLLSASASLGRVSWALSPRAGSRVSGPEGELLGS